MCRGFAMYGECTNPYCMYKHPEIHDAPESNFEYFPQIDAYWSQIAYQHPFVPPEIGNVSRLTEL